MENKDNEEYKKRIKALIEKVEKEKDAPEGERLVLEAKERLKQTAISKIHPIYRNEKIIIVFVYMIRDYYKQITDSTSPYEKDQLQEEIDGLFNLIYEELKKPNLLIHNRDPVIKAKVEDLDKKRILTNMARVLGEENINQFYKRFNIRKSIGLEPMTNAVYFVCIFVIIFVIMLTLIVLVSI